MAQRLGDLMEQALEDFIQQEWPRDSSAVQTAVATLLSLLE